MNSHRKRYGGEVQKGPEHRSFCPLGVGVHYPPSKWICSLTWKIFKPHTFGILWRLHHVGMIHQLHFQPSPLSCLQRRGVGCKFKLLILLTLPGDQPPHPGAHQEFSHRKKTCSHHPGNYRGLRNSVPESGEIYILLFNNYRPKYEALYYKTSIRKYRRKFV